MSGAADGAARKARQHLEVGSRAASNPVEIFEVPGARHGFLARDLSAYDLPQAEAAWTRIQAFLKQRLLPPPPKIPTPPGVKPAGPAARTGDRPGPETVAPPSGAAPAPATPAPAPTGAPA